jgi:hypothetical protein
MIPRNARSTLRRGRPYAAAPYIDLTHLNVSYRSLFIDPPDARPTGTLVFHLMDCS